MEFLSTIYGESSNTFVAGTRTEGDCPFSTQHRLLREVFTECHVVRRSRGVSIVRFRGTSLLARRGPACFEKTRCIQACAAEYTSGWKATNAWRRVPYQ